MKICIICEGCYPYITGGVSSWIQMILTSMPEHEFIICTINTNCKREYKYDIPKNVVGIREIFLDEYINEDAKKIKKIKFNSNTKQALEAFLKNEKVDWESVFSYFSGGGLKSINNFIMSQDFFDIALDVYLEKYSQTAFTDYYWAVRSMILPFISIMRQSMPEADLYHSVSTGYAGIMGSLAKYLYNKPFVVTEHGIYTREREEEIIKSDVVKGCYKDVWINYFYSISSCAYNFADKVTTLFEKNKEIEIALGCDEGKIEVIPNGVEVTDFYNISPKDTHDEYINIGAIVRVVPIKDIKTMIQSFALVKEEIPNAKFFIIGPTDENEHYFDECIELVSDMKIKDLVFTGVVDVKEYIGKMDILTLTSISEGQPLALLEAMACGIPSVSTDVGSCKELLYGLDDDIGRAGVIARVMDYGGIADALIYLCKNEAQRSIMGENALKRVSEIYTKKGFIEKYKDIYKSYEVEEWQGSVSNLENYLMKRV